MSMAPWIVSSTALPKPLQWAVFGFSRLPRTQGWQGVNRWRNSPKNNGNGNWPEREYEFNGLDYMLMHNLFFLHANGYHAVQIPQQVPANCGDFDGLLSLINADPTDSATYDPYDPCMTVDETYGIVAALGVFGYAMPLTAKLPFLQAMVSGPVHPTAPASFPLPVTVALRGPTYL